MDWARVIEALRNESHSLIERAASAFPDDLTTQREMRTRAQIARMLADALQAGLTSA